MPMSIERVLAGTGLGLASSLVSGSLNLGEVRRGEHLVQTTVDTTAWVAACIFASEYLYVPGFAPIVIAAFLRLHRIGLNINTKIAELTKKE